MREATITNCVSVVAGIIIMGTGIGLGGGLIISAFVHAPKEFVRYVNN